MRRLLRWLIPGLNLKRWLLVFSGGVFLIGLGISLMFNGDLFARVENFIWKYARYVNRDYSPAPWGIFAVCVGVLLAYLGMVRMVRAVVETLVPDSGPKADRFYQQRALLKGPKVVALGGGTGLPATLRGLKEYTAHITAIVTVADDGGSSGRLRDEFGILPPGDIRNCLVALADTEPLMEKLFQYRFQYGEGLEGHSFGNLFLLAMSQVTGDFETAIRESSGVLAVRGRVLPSTLDSVVLKAELQGGAVVTGESRIGRSPISIRRVFLEPENCRPVAEAVQALLEADVVVLGPGSLYTSIIPNLLIPGIADALRRTRALKVYVCNIMSQPGETDGYTASQHVKAIIDHAGFGVVDYMLVNGAPIPEALLMKYDAQGAAPIAVDLPEIQRLGVALRRADLLDASGGFVRHDPHKLAKVVGRLVVDQRLQDQPPWSLDLMRQRLQRR